MEILSVAQGNGMAWRKWIVRGLVLVATCFLIAGALFFRYWTDPELVRQKVVEKLSTDFRNVRVSLDSAHLRLFGGISLSELRLSRRDDLANRDFAYIPSAVISHDKEQLLSGSLAIRKIELRKPYVRIVRDQEGRWNLSGLMASGGSAGRLPATVIREGTIVFLDQWVDSTSAPTEIRNVHLTALNDPIHRVTFEGRGECPVIGPVHLSGHYDRQTGAMNLRVEARKIPIGLPLLQRMARYLPTITESFKDLKGMGNIALTLERNPGSAEPWTYQVDATLSEAQWSHRCLPWPLRDLKLTVNCANGIVSNATLSASGGDARLQASLQDLNVNQCIAGAWWYAAQHVEVKAKHLHIDEAFYHRLPKAIQDYMESYQEDYTPTGKISATFVCERLSQGKWRRHWAFQAENVETTYRYFPYPVTDVTGTMEVVQIGAPPGLSSLTGDISPASPSPFRPMDEQRTIISFDLKGRASGAPISMSGLMQGSPEDYGIDIKISGKDLPINRALMQALSDQYREVAQWFEPTGLLDFKLALRRDRGEKSTRQHCALTMHQGTVRYRELPLLLTNVSGTLILHPDHWELANVVGHHNGGQIMVSGRSHPDPITTTIRRTTHFSVEPGQSDAQKLEWEKEARKAEQRKERISLRIEGREIPLDKELETAISTGRETLGQAWRTFAIEGRMNFVAAINDLPDKPRDMDITVTVGGCRMKPSFFPYPLEDVSGTVRYVNNTLQLYNVRGKHPYLTEKNKKGTAELSVDRGVVLLKEKGGYWAELKDLRARSLVLDPAFLAALPQALRDAATNLKLKEPIQSATHMIIDQSPDSTIQPAVWWSTMIQLHKANLNTGVDLKKVDGKVGCTGLYKDGRLHDLLGRLSLKQAYVYNQPLRSTTGRFAVWKKTPDVLRIWDLHSDLFGGTVGGQVRVELGSIFRYELILKAVQVRLEQFGQHNLGKDADLSGLVTAGLYLKGKGTDLSGLSGNGTVSVPDGKMYRLPLLLDLLKWLGLRLPDRTAFEQAYIRFAIEGSKVRIEDLDLYGNAISVRGKGTMQLDGTDLNLDLHADWGRLLQLLPRGLDNITREISNQLLKITVRGKLSEVKFGKQLVPVVTDPLRNLWQGLRERR